MQEWMNECSKESVLLLEGSDDCNIVKRFCESNGVKGSFGFCNCGNDSRVLAKLNALLKADERPKVIGVIIDADNNIDARYQEVKNKVSEFYKKIPLNITNKGLVHSENKLPKLGIWIMPNNQNNGALEEFYLELATEINTDFIDNLIKQAKSENLTSFKPQHRTKAIMHTYFAWQDKPGAPLHSSINKIALNNNAYIAKTFKSWLTKLFS